MTILALSLVGKSISARAPFFERNGRGGKLIPGVKLRIGLILLAECSETSLKVGSNNMTNFKASITTPFGVVTRDT